MSRKKLYFVAIAFCVLTFVGMSAFSSDSIFGTLVAKANHYYLEISAGSPLNENWTNTARINTDDDWTQVVAIEGFSGDGLAPVPGTDPRTILTDSPGNPLDVKANQTNPATSTVDGVAEFEIANPTIALKGSDTATAPNIVIHLNTTIGCVGKGVIVNFKVRDIDDSANDAVSPVATQFRVGGSGNYRNITSAFIPDATTGPSQATRVTSISATLPVSSSNQPMLDFRIITTNAVGPDEWIGIDDINIDCTHPTTATAFVSGRVTDNFGRGVSKAQVTILNMQTGGTRTVLTSPFGWYSFDEMEVGVFYTVSIAHKRYDFGKSTQVFQLFEDMNEINFVGN
ncbi:MAG TPA: carboxypeptidase-like regulatory domain-containing protein [Pyrinomonadaceae bacterium]|jgi:hypothetical protein